MTRTIISMWLLVMLAAGCRKEASSVQVQQLDGSTIKYVLNDNFVFTITIGGLQLAGLLDTLAQPGPYTLLAPDNQAFAAINMNNTDYNYFGVDRTVNAMRYYVLPGKQVFSALPLGDNQPLTSYNGGKVYVSRYLKGADTITTVNGVTLRTLDNPASNGLIQVMTQYTNPQTYPTLATYLHNDTTLTLFAAALQRCKIDVSLLAGEEAYTLLAPSNRAFQLSAALAGFTLGVNTLNGILQADSTQLDTFLRNHILKGRYFQGDLYRLAQADPTGIATLSGGKVIIGGTPTAAHAITFRGQGNSNPSAIYAGGPITMNYADYPTGNGVIHIIDQVLLP